MSDTKKDEKSKALPAKQVRTAGEVRFVKDKSDGNQWAFDDKGTVERHITPDFAFNPKNSKQLACALRSTSMALGHALSAYNAFTKIKSSDVSPDGALGGKGYVMKIRDMRQMFMNSVEALSALGDTLYDEVRAPHWAPVSRQEDPEDQREIEEIIEDAEEIREDPEAFAKGEEQEMDKENKRGKKASHRLSLAHRVADRYLNDRPASIACRVAAMHVCAGAEYAVYEPYSKSIQWTGSLKDFVTKNGHLTRHTLEQIRDLEVGADHIIGSHLMIRRVQ